VNRDIDIALAVEGDLSAIVEIVNHASAAHSPANLATEPEPVALWRKWWSETHARYPWLVARAGGRVLGFGKASPHRARGGYAWSVETSVYVDSRARGERIGTRLYDQLIAMLRAQGYITAIAGIMLPNPPSERLHAAFGFVHRGTFHRVGWKHGRWHDVAYYDLALAPDCAPGPIVRVADVWRCAAREHA
jgi:phosphinothricin acetyltransferase